MTRRSLFVTLLAAAFSACFAPLSQAGTLGPLTYTDNGISITITGCDWSASGTVSVPAFIDGKPVTVIGPRAFSGCRMTRVSLPDGITRIKEDAFSFCGPLQSINFPEGLVEIGSGGFAFCQSLGDVAIPASLTSGYGVFSSSGVRSVTFARGTTSVVDGLLMECWKLEEVTLPATVTRIGDHAFAECRNLEEVILPRAVKLIGSGAFTGTRLETLTIPDSVTVLGEAAFSWCAYLKSVRLPSGLKEISPRTFLYCERLTDVVIPAGVTGIGEEALAGTYLTLINIPANVNKIGDKAFMDVRTLKSAVFTGKAPSLGKRVFSGASPDFVIFVGENSTGFTLPKWKGYRTSLPRPEIVVLLPDGKDAASESQQSFKATIAGKTGEIKSFTILNVGSRKLTKLKASIRGKDPLISEFSIKGTVPESLAPGKSAVVKSASRRRERASALRISGSEVTTRTRIRS